MAPSRGRGQRISPPPPVLAPPPDPATPFSALVRDVLLHTLSLCDGGDDKDAATNTATTLVRLAAVDRGTRRLLHSGDDFFRDVAHAAWGLLPTSSPCDPHGRPVGCWKECVASHERVLGALGRHGRASARAWHRLRAVLPPALLATLMPPLPDDQLSRLKRCGWHDSVVAYAAVCDGQVRVWGMGR